MSKPQVVNKSIFKHESEVRSYCRTFNTTFTSATGSFLVADTGQRYIDFLAGCSALNYGHNDPDLIARLTDYISGNGVVHGLDMHTRAKAEFIDAFTSLILTPRDLLYRLQFTGPTGTNAVEAAMKLARKVTGRSQIVAFTGGFHGVSLGALAATANSHHRMQGTQTLPDVTRAFYDGYFGPEIDTAAMLDKALCDPSSGYDRPAAILLETVQGEGGLNAASAKWLQSIARIAKRHGALLIVDDIQAGCGRTGSFFGFEKMGIKPDIVTLSKSLSGIGLPMSVVLIAAEFDQWLPGEHNGTFRGNNLAFVTAAEAIRKFWATPTLSNAIAVRGDLIKSRLSKLAELDTKFRVKGRGMFLGLDVGSGALASAISTRAFKHGLVIETAGAHGEVVKVLAPLTTPEKILVEGLDILANAINSEIQKELVA